MRLSRSGSRRLLRGPGWRPIRCDISSGRGWCRRRGGMRRGGGCTRRRMWR
ncbi:hypothetical protein L083_3900 [Actinoplanes sp. N902-109]|nr:hypothetical protein L083_3900 [Actinoplanes sp. N902-109]